MNPILIAECCQNHNGRRDVLQRMIHRAAEAGANYVKLQAIRSRELTHRPRFEQGVRRIEDGKEIQVEVSVEDLLLGDDILEIPLSFW